MTKGPRRQTRYMSSPVQVLMVNTRAWSPGHVTTTVTFWSEPKEDEGTRDIILQTIQTRGGGELELIRADSQLLINKNLNLSNHLPQIHHRHSWHVRDRKSHVPLSDQEHSLHVEELFSNNKTMIIRIFSRNLKLKPVDQDPDPDLGPGPVPGISSQIILTHQIISTVSQWLRDRDILTSTGATSTEIVSHKMTEILITTHSWCEI